MDLTNEDVADILALLDSLPYDELDLQTPRFRLLLRRTPGGWTQATEVLAGAAGAVTDGVHPSAVLLETASMEHRGRYSDINAPSMSLGEKREAPASGADDAGEVSEDLVAVRAPLPGTFYRAPRPAAAPFVEVGSEVGADTVIGIVETMKLMNPVHAGVAGTVAGFCVANGEFAAHGAALLRIRTGR